MLAREGQSVIARLDSLKAQVEQGKAEKAKAEANKETYEKQLKELVAQLAEMQVAPENLDAEIQALEVEINQALAKAEELLKAPAPEQPQTENQPAQPVATFVQAQVSLEGV